MKRIFIILLLVLLFSVALVSAIEYDPGYLLLSYGNYTLETSVWVGAAVFLTLFILVYGFFSLLRRTVSGSTAVGRWFSSQGYRRSQQQTTKGLIAFIEGNWETSRRILARTAEKSETPLLNYLIAARASHALDDGQQMKEFLKKAEQSTTGAGIAVGLTQAELQIRSGRFEQALATLTRVRRNAGKHPFVSNLLRQAYLGLNDWQQLLALLPELKKYKVLSPEQLQALEIKACKESILDVARLKHDTLPQLTKLWSSLPKSATKNSEVLACYVEQLIKVGGVDEAEKRIREHLKKHWDKKLITLYGKMAINDTGKQLLYAEKWLQERNNDADLLLCLGRLSLRNSLWGKAREYFENSLKLEARAEVCAELGRLLSHLGEHEKSNEYFQQGLMMVAGGLVDLPMPHRVSG